MLRKSLAIWLFFCLFGSTALAPAQCTRCGRLLRMSPTALNFGSVPVGKRSAALRVSVRSLGTFPAIIARISIVGAGFTQTNTCPKTLPNGTGCTISVVFAPVALQTYMGQLTITYNGTTKAITTLAGQGVK